jgi:hypothetical protein
MKLALNLCLFLIAFLMLGDKSFSLSDYQIKKICKNEKIISKCMKTLKDRKSKLKKGDLIEIPVIPYRR